MVAVVSVPWQSHAATPRGTLSSFTFASAAVEADRQVDVYLPPGYVAGAAGPRYPVIYLLHGLGGEGSDWFGWCKLGDHLDRLITAGQIEPVIAVAPDGDDGYWTNHAPHPTDGAAPRWGDYVVVEVVAEVDQRYRTRPAAASRALVGASMGGFGSMSLALQRPDVFGAVVSLAGALFREVPSHRRVYRDAWGHPPSPVAYAAVSPLHIIRAKPDAAAFPAIYLACGDDDHLGFLDYLLAAHRLLDERGVPHELRITDGGHAWTAWEPLSPDWLRFLDATRAAGRSR